MPNIVCFSHLGIFKHPWSPVAVSARFCGVVCTVALPSRPREPSRRRHGRLIPSPSFWAPASCWPPALPCRTQRVCWVESWRSFSVRTAVSCWRSRRPRMAPHRGRGRHSRPCVRPTRPSYEAPFRRWRVPFSSCPAQGRGGGACCWGADVLLAAVPHTQAPVRATSVEKRAVSALRMCVLVASLSGAVEGSVTPASGRRKARPSSRQRALVCPHFRGNEPSLLTSRSPARQGLPDRPQHRYLPHRQRWGQQRERHSSSAAAHPFSLLAVGSPNLAELPSLPHLGWNLRGPVWCCVVCGWRYGLASSRGCPLDRGGLLSCGDVERNPGPPTMAGLRERRDPQKLQGFDHYRPTMGSESSSSGTDSDAPGRAASPTVDDTDTASATSTEVEEHVPSAARHSDARKCPGCQGITLGRTSCAHLKALLEDMDID